MKQIDLIIFDLDGTLVDSQQAIGKGVNTVLKKIGVKPKDAAEIISYIGKGEDYLIEKSLGAENQKLFEQMRAGLDDYRRNHPDEARLYPGVQKILEHFKEKQKIIVTNRKQKSALLTLNRLGILNYFAEVIGADDLTCLKPSACPLDRILEKLNIDKAKSIMVGDMDIDVLAGKNAGIATCAVTYGIGKKEDIIKSNPDYIIDNISQLKAIIN